MAGGTFPTSLPTYTITSGGETANGAGGGTGLSGLLNAFETDVTALAAKVGTGATVPAANTVLFGTGANTSSWQGLTSAQLAAVMSDETGTGALVFASSPTIVTPTIASFTNAQHNHSNAAGGGAIDGTNGISPGTITSPSIATGMIVQVVVTTFSAAATGTTVIPSDDTIPQNTEGDQYMTQVITPKSATNRMFIEAKFQGAISVAPNDMTAALYQDATANAVAAGHTVVPTAGFMGVCMIGHDMVTGTTGATTFKVRGGSGSAATLTFNGSAGVRRYGGISFSYLKITEYKV